LSARSYLYVPGTRPDRIDKAVASGADIVILDLEDAVAFGEKESARDNVARWVRTHGSDGICVRINGGELLEADARAVIDAGARLLSLPKATVDELARLDAVVGTSAADVIALIETSTGVFDAREIALHPRVVRLAIGEADLSAELAIEISGDGREMMPMRAHVVLASAAAGIEQPVGPVSTDFADLDAYRDSARALKRMGFGARAAIHPAQVAIINETFSPSAEEIARARALIAKLDAAGGNVTLDDEGRMLDEAFVRAARRILARAKDL